MKCPNCQHISDTAILECSACGTAYDRGKLERLGHLEYVLAWLDSRAPRIGRGMYSRLHEEVTNEFKALRDQLIPRPPAPVVSPAPSTTRPMEDLAGDLTLTRLMIDKLPDWLKASGIAPLTGKRLKGHLE